MLEEMAIRRKIRCKIFKFFQYVNSSKIKHKSNVQKPKNDWNLFNQNVQYQYIRQINIWKIFPKAINLFYGKQDTLFTTLILFVSSEIEQLYVLPKLCSILLLGRISSQYGGKLLLKKTLFCAGKLDPPSIVFVNSSWHSKHPSNCSFVKTWQ